ncbi:MAG: LpxL/LpxP family acyltransferase [Flavobacteriales bacterium]|jgi:predicted LPLAT superfamily acyltransferase
MSQWDGKSKGAVLGYKIFIFFIQKLGIRAAYVLLYLVALYYFLFSIKGRNASFYYFHKRLGYTKLKSFISVYISYYNFGKTIIDKFAISSGLRDKFTFEFDGEHHINEIVKEKKGGILISAHVGNFEISQYCFTLLDQHSEINLVTTDNEHSAIKDYLDSVSLKSSIKFIIIKDDMSHIFNINNALRNNELVCFTGDRYFEGSKILKEELLGKETNFPAGVFMLASRLKVPVIFLYIMKEPKLHYHFYAEKANFKNREAQGLLNQYTQSMERKLKKYPYQWFNYYDFWNDLK